MACIVAYAFSLSLPITFPWTILVIGLIVSLLISWLENPTLRGQIRFVQDLAEAPLTKPLLIFAAVVGVSGFVNGGFPEAFKSLSALRGGLVYFWAHHAFKSEDGLRKNAVLSLLVVGALAGFIASIEQVTDSHPFSSFRYLQGTGFLATPMAFAGTMQIFSMLAFGLVIGQSFRKSGNLLSKPWVIGLVVLGNLAGLVFAGERSAWFGALTAVVICTAIFSHILFWRTAIGATLITAVSCVAVPVVRDRLLALANWQSDVSAQVRLKVWSHAWKVFEQHPLFGVGIRKFPPFPVPANIAPGHAPLLDHAHSNYLQMLATAGIFGFISYIYLWFVVIRECLVRIGFAKQTQAEQEKSHSRLFLFDWTFEQGLSFGIMTGAVALLISGLFEYNFGTGQIRLAQWFVLAMLI